MKQKVLVKRNCFYAFLVACLMLTLAIFSVALLGSKSAVSVSASNANFEEAKVLKLSLDFGEDFAAAKTRRFRNSFSKVQGAERAKTQLAAGDKIVYDFYSPDVDAGAFTGQYFKALADAPWASEHEFMSAEGNFTEQNVEWSIWSDKNVKAWTQVTRTVSEGASIIGKDSNFFSLFYSSAAAQAARYASVYYKNFRIEDSSGKVKLYLFNNYAQYTFLTGEGDEMEGGSASVSITNDPILATTRPVAKNLNAIRYTLDLGASHNTASSKLFNAYISSLAESATIAAGDIIEYDIYSPIAYPGEIHLAGQLAPSWASVSGGTVMEYNKEVGISWTTLQYNSANGDTPGADLSLGYHSRRLLVTANSVLVGQKLHHVSFKFISTRAIPVQFLDIYIKNIRIRNDKNEIKQVIFDGSQTAVKGGHLDNEGAASVLASVKVEKDPFFYPNKEVPTFIADSPSDTFVSASFKFSSNAETNNYYEASLLDSSGYTQAIKSGDKLSYLFRTNSYASGLGLIDIEFNDGSRLSSGNITDNLGVKYTKEQSLFFANKELNGNDWLLREVDLSAFANKTIAKWIVGTWLAAQVETESVGYDFDSIKINDSVILNADTFDSSKIIKLSSTADALALIERQPKQETNTADSVLANYNKTASGGVIEDTSGKLTAAKGNSPITIFGTEDDQWNATRIQSLGKVSACINANVDINANTVAIHIPWVMIEPVKGFYDLGVGSYAQQVIDMASAAGLNVVIYYSATNYASGDGDFVPDYISYDNETYQKAKVNGKYDASTVTVNNHTDLHDYALPFTNTGGIGVNKSGRPAKLVNGKYVADASGAVTSWDVLAKKNEGVSASDKYLKSDAVDLNKNKRTLCVNDTDTLLREKMAVAELMKFVEKNNKGAANTDRIVAINMGSEFDFSREISPSNRTDSSFRCDCVLCNAKYGNGSAYSSPLDFMAKTYGEYLGGVVAEAVVTYSDMLIYTPVCSIKYAKYEADKGEGTLGQGDNGRFAEQPEILKKAVVDALTAAGVYKNNYFVSTSIAYTDSASNLKFDLNFMDKESVNDGNFAFASGVDTGWGTVAHQDVKNNKHLEIVPWYTMFDYGGIGGIYWNDPSADIANSGSPQHTMVKNRLATGFSPLKAGEFYISRFKANRNVMNWWNYENKAKSFSLGNFDVSINRPVADAEGYENHGYSFIKSDRDLYVSSTAYNNKNRANNINISLATGFNGYRVERGYFNNSGNWVRFDALTAGNGYTVNGNSLTINVASDNNADYTKAIYRVVNDSLSFVDYPDSSELIPYAEDVSFDKFSNTSLTAIVNLKGRELVNLTVDDVALSSTDYLVSGNEITFAKDYLMGLTENKIIKASNAFGTATFTLAIEDSSQTISGNVGASGATLSFSNGIVATSDSSGGYSAVISSKVDYSLSISAKYYASQVHEILKQTGASRTFNAALIKDTAEVKISLSQSGATVKIGSVTATEENKTYTLTVEQGANKTLSIEKEGYVAQNILIADLFQNTVLDYATLEKVMFAVGATSPLGATVTLVGDLTEIEHGATLTFTITAVEGYDISNMVVKNNNSTTGIDFTSGAYTIKNVTGNINITVEGVKLKTYTATFPTSIHYEFTQVGGTSNINHGESLSFRISLNPNSSYTGISGVRYMGNELVGVSGVYTINNITANLVANQFVVMFEGQSPLDTAKALAIDELNASFNLTDYTTAKALLVSSAIERGIVAINSCTEVFAVESVLNAALAEIRLIPTIAYMNENMVLDRIEIITPPTKTAYIEGKSFDKIGMVVKAFYTFENLAYKEEIITDYTLDKNTLALGNTFVVVSFNGKNVNQTVSVTEKTLIGISIKTPPTKLIYFAGNSFNANGLVLTLSYDNGESVDISSGYSVDKTVLGSTDSFVIISFGGKSVNQAITVNARTLSSIAIKDSPTKLDYVEGNVFSKTGMVVVAIYDNGDEVEITDYTLDKTSLKLGDTFIVIAFSGKTVNQAITVKAKTITGIEIKTNPNKISYIEGNAFNKTGMVIVAVYDNGDEAIITDYTLDKTVLVLGDIGVVASYQNKTVTIAISVSAKTLVAISAQGEYKTAYIEGTLFSTVGLEIIGSYDNGTEEAITSYLAYGEKLKLTDTFVTVSYGGKEIKIEITVAKKTITKIEISKNPTKMSYADGDKIDLSGMEVVAVYNNGEREIITDFTVDLEVVTKTDFSAKISFNGFSAVVKFEVTDKVVKGENGCGCGAIFGSSGAAIYVVIPCLIALGLALLFIRKKSKN